MKVGLHLDYIHVGPERSNAGHTLKSIAILSQIIRLEPGHLAL